MTKWYDVPGYEGLYQVTKCGEVRSLDRLIIRKDGVSYVKSGRIMKQSMACTGKYLCVGLSKDAKTKIHTVHSIIALTFIGPRPVSMDILHGAGGRCDNSVGNLSYGTRKANMADKKRDGTHREGVEIPSCQLGEEQVRWIREQVANGTPQTEVCNVLGLNSSHVSKIVNRMLWKHI